MSLRTKLKKVLPSISITEQEALDAGDVWLEGSIYQGKPDFNALRAVPAAVLSADEQAFIDGPLQELLGMIDDTEIQNGIHLPEYILDFLKKERFFSLIIPKSFGGLEFSPYANSTIVGTIATKSSAVAVTVMVPNSLGPGELLLHFGTKEQQAHYLPRLANGRDIPCFALTSPEAGSDAGGIPDLGTVTKGMYNGEEVLGLEITWDKRYITLAPIATVLGLAFKVVDPNGLLGGKENLGITCALIPKEHPGVELGNRHDPMGIRFYNGTTRGNKVFVPMDFIIGGQKNIGRGWQMLVSCLGAGRGISLPALGVSSSQVAFKGASEYAAVREQFGLAIGQFEGIQEKLADIAGKTYLQEAMRVLTTEGLGMGLKPSVVTAIAKYHMTEIGRDVLDSAMDIQAGKAIQNGPQNTLASGYVAQPIAITVEGANILTRNLMIFGQGVMRCHPYLQSMVESIHSEDKNADKEFNRILRKTVGYSVANSLRAFRLGVLPFTAGANSPLPEVREYEKAAHKLSAKLAVYADFSLLVLGGKLKQAEMLSARLGDVMSFLYAAMASIKYYEQKVASSEREQAAPYFHYATRFALQSAEQALHKFLDNFPASGTRKFMRFITMNYSTKMPKISDDLIRELATQAQLDTAFKKQITHLVKPIEGDGHYINEQAYKAKMGCLDLLAKVKKALRAKTIKPGIRFALTLDNALVANVITEEEYAKLIDYNKKRERAIRVDEFDFDMNLLDENAKPINPLKSVVNQ
ncbi:acyl-CoA dehydrogenase [Pseudoalteromonas sp. SR44-5]|jgi:acyl-CoA dehydrogenase|uniref:Acyl-coenzyme A dehydrogenase n=1 Tax=Pseudoalteromonas neustonica TaxID=1840331 RepID=A0ABY3FG85_9GAMM|nr:MULTISPECIES: acyl-CoA dehydrogenase [Pseudoalteromonas]MBB1367585.1 acyl-CoA dehydrogenase [Pseudoalteromonas sp. SR44-5]MBB1423327.1 acyl-CoA dehydrogenase [Pseudoalteromonas sp. SG43-7]MBB1435293.1 acyl-CoA dehydrogenase [Pseudoalteromonas sp. SG43-6]MBB1470349.1 acyl-CoA dehydrogenase [Pseudoalteromonas sp. SG41-5]MBB1479311.1 acyl-CoA dehydrogenase [Pseudoalteromonas sp. SG41-2]|tara:strand:+ start:4669 stop:6924 length:2256 start_codon:yes stop_codon:yes gene_type:complete